MQNEECRMQNGMGTCKSLAEAQDMSRPEILQIIHRKYRKKKRQSKSFRIHSVILHSSF